MVITLQESDDLFHTTMQSKREAAYFVVVLHDKKTVLIGLRGTETPEDLITDGLCRECVFTKEDLDGLVK